MYEIREADLTRDLQAIRSLWLEYLTLGNDEAEPRPGNNVRIRDLWLENDPGRYSDRQNSVEDFLVSQK